MSVINQMLQELEQRRADAGTSAAQVRAVVAQKRRRSVPWTVLTVCAAVMIVLLGYWVLARRPVAVSVPSAETLQRAEQMPQVLQLAGELSQLPAAVERHARQPVPPARPESADQALIASATESLPGPLVEAPKPAGAADPVRPVEISKEIKQISPQQRAENAYRLAYASLQQGRMGEAEESLRQALQHEPRHAAARQALAALLVEAKQLGRAEQLLQQGLELQPGHSGYAMTLARLQVERGDVAAALATLQRNPPSGENAEYHGFMAALLQRSERHKEAIEQYQIALRSNPGAGPWLLGLGISLQADNQSAKAAEVFRRAKSSTTLSPELQAFAEQRLKQLQ